ncbi:MAG: hypothetical protein SGPRY_013915, partial [Prymnesium sp.]
ASDWQILLSLCARDLPLLLTAFVALCFAAAGDALLPQLQSEALNVLLYTEPSSVSTTLRTPLIKLLSVGVLTALFTGIRGFLFWLSGGRLVKRLRAALFSSLLTKPQTFYDTRGTGELSSRLSADCIKLSDVLSLNVNIVLRQVLYSTLRKAVSQSENICSCTSRMSMVPGQVIQSVAGITIVAKMSGRLAAIVLAGVTVRGVINYAYAAVNKRLAKAQQAALADSASVADQTLSLMPVVRAHGNQKYEERRYEGQLSRLLSIQTSQGALYGGSRVVNGGLNALLLCSVMAFGGSLVAAGVLPARMMTSFVFYTEFIGAASFDVTDQWRSIQEAMGAASEVFHLLENSTITPPPSPPCTRVLDTSTTTVATADPLSTSAPLTRRGKLEAEGLSFAYPSRSSEQVMRQLSLTIPPGSHVAIMGTSGGGKSTLFKLILRFYEPSSGSIFLDGRPLDQIPESELRRLVAWVPQVRRGRADRGEASK